ncbi:hydrogen gas-evolving membrane-bound hydrogenase subunit E [Ostreibacterium oceani]|uniref:DUF4040 domain-containing protein n=1 Tax=Ostreibacterium oceani TaxID=2654998 RepID=A0A6N7F3R5_9GAMM|nr:hydrogen gas-evolving membrane-bound hydrogenase subunit E [Ostreibacterium oceani]MPV86516.1 DUF4040 domain-containing protein [Ostreibacterium oceani]
MMLALVLLGFFVALLTPWLYRVFRAYTGLFLALYPGAAFIWFITQYNEVIAKQSIIHRFDWLPSLGVELSFKLDGLSLLFALLITGIGVLVLVYSNGYMKSYARVSRFYVVLLLFMASMLGVVLSDNIISLFVFWELTSLTSYFLIGFTHENSQSREAALKALIITAGGGLALLAGFIILGSSAQSYDLSRILASAQVLQEHALLPAAMALIIIGCFSKSAQFPFQFWLPAAMAAPTPVSAYLHSATMVKAGIYLLARMSPLFNGEDGWNASLVIFGAITMLIGATVAVIQSDLKTLLANTTVSALGLITMLIGIGTEYALHAAVIFIFAHALYKGSLFLITGIIDKQTGTRQIRQLGQLFRDMPITGTITLFACLSMAGIAPLFGFISKETSYAAMLDMQSNAPLTTTAFFIASVMFMAAALMISYFIFFGKKRHTLAVVNEASIGLWIGPLIMTGLSLVFGLFGGLIAPLLNQAAVAILPTSNALKLSLWHGFNIALLLSVVTIVVGFCVFLFIYLKPKHMKAITISENVRISHAYDEIMQSIIDVAIKITRRIQHGYVRMYLFTIFVTFCLLALWILKDLSIPAINISWQEFRVYDIVVGLIMLTACFYTVVAQSRLLAIALLGVVGYGLAFIFIMFGAPDLAITQFLIETLTVVIFVLVLWKLPKYLVFNQGAIPFRYLVVSILFGAIMAWVTMIVTQYPLDSHLKAYFAENSYLLAKGKNVVNVILVDFRSLDTLGEIVVLGIAAIGVYALVKFSKTTNKAQI